MYVDEGDSFETEVAEKPIETGAAEEMMTASPVLAVQAQHEIQSAIIVAKRYERNESVIYQKFVFGSCKRLGFAMSAEYEFKRGRKKDNNGQWVDNIVKGATVKTARELARLWGNIRYGALPISDSSGQRQILSYSWDLQSNTWIQQGDLFDKLVQKKGKNGETAWVEPDEREMRELSNRRAALGIRNCILQIVPSDFIEDGLAQCKETLRLAISDSKSEQFRDVKKRLIAGFSAINVPVAELEQYIGHALDSCDSKELETLRGIWAAIKDGHTSWSSYRDSENGADDLPTEIKRASHAPTASSVEAHKADTQRAMEEARRAQDKLDRERGASPKTQPSAATATTPADSKASPTSQEPVATSASSSTKPSPGGRKAGLFE